MTPLNNEQQAAVRAELARIAEAHGSQRAAGRAIGLTGTQISDILAGKKAPGEKTVQILSELLGEEFALRLESLAGDSPAPAPIRPASGGTPIGTYVEREDRYDFAQDVARKLVEDGFCEDAREAARLVGEVVFYEGTRGVNAEDLYRAVVRHINRSRKPWKAGIGERVLTGDDDK